MAKSSEERPDVNPQSADGEESAVTEESADGEESADKEGSLFKRMKDKAREVQSSVAEKIAETSEAAQEKLREKLNELNSLLPAIRELGYSVDAVEIGIGLLPDVAIDVSGLAKTMDEATYERVMEEQKDNKVISLILRTLHTASMWQRKVHLMEMVSDQATITLGIPPKMTLKFHKATS